MKVQEIIEWLKLVSDKNILHELKSENIKKRMKDG